MFKNETYLREKCLWLKIVFFFLSKKFKYINYKWKRLGLVIEQGFLYWVAGDTREMKLHVFLSDLTES